MELCIALDLPTKEENLALAGDLSEFEGLWLKVGFRSFIRDGRELIEALREAHPSCRIFLDLKLYDIPNTMADAAEEIARMGVEMFNIHASAGEEAMRTVMKRLEPFGKRRPLVLAVTALTSFDEEGFARIYRRGIDEAAEAFARSAYEAGLDGVVCSVFESRRIKKISSERFVTLTPGIRPMGEEAGDQKRVATLERACAEKVDYPVVGRPVYRDPDPRQKVARLLEEIGRVCEDSL